MAPPTTTPAKPATVALISAVVSALITMGSIFIYAGGALNRLENNERQIQQLTDTLRTIEANMVNKEDFREVRSDVKELLRSSAATELRKGK